MPGSDRKALKIAALATALATGVHPLPDPMERYCVEPDVCFFEMACTKQSWSDLEAFYKEKGWPHDVVAVSGRGAFELAVKSKPYVRHVTVWCGGRLLAGQNRFGWSGCCSFV